MKMWIIIFQALIGSTLTQQIACAQYYGGGFGYGGGYGGSSMGSFAPPHSIGGYYPVPFSTIFPGYVGNGYNPGFFGAGPMNMGPYGNGGYGYVGSNGIGGYDAYGRVPALAPVQQPAAMPQSALPSNSQVIHSGAPIKLACPKTAPSSMSYSLNGTIFTIQPGYSQSFRDDRDWKLEFRRGGEASEVVTYTLKPGNYNFAVGSSGWELRQVVTVTKGDLPPAPQPAPVSSATPALNTGPTPLPPP